MLQCIAVYFPLVTSTVIILNHEVDLQYPKSNKMGEKEKEGKENDLHEYTEKKFS